MPSGETDTGWLIYSYTPACICGDGDAMNSSQALCISQKGSVWYAAIRVLPKCGRLPSGLDDSGDYETDATGSYTFAAVFLTTRQDGRWG